MKWWEISRPCNLHTNSPLMPPGGLLLAETEEEWRAAWSRQQPACAAILPSLRSSRSPACLHSAFSEQLAGFPESVGRPEQNEDNERNFKSLLPFCTFFAHSLWRTWFSRHPASTFFLSLATPLSKVLLSRFFLKWSSGEMGSGYMVPRRCYHRANHRGFVFLNVYFFLFQSWNTYPCSMSVTLYGTFPCTFSAYLRLRKK